jgi:hypothetical protein
MRHLLTTIQISTPRFAAFFNELNKFRWPAFSPNTFKENTVMKMNSFSASLKKICVEYYKHFPPFFSLHPIKNLGSNVVSAFARRKEHVERRVVVPRIDKLTLLREDQSVQKRFVFGNQLLCEKIRTLLFLPLFLVLPVNEWCKSTRHFA